MLRITVGNYLKSLGLALLFIHRRHKIMALQLLLAIASFNSQPKGSITDEKDTFGVRTEHRRTGCRTRSS
jgi:hypothetical protein